MNTKNYAWWNWNWKTQILLFQTPNLTRFLSVKNGFKYFIGYKDDKKVKSLGVMLPKMSGYMIMKLNVFFDRRW